jgi:hypothetical protein
MRGLLNSKGELGRSRRSEVGAAAILFIGPIGHAATPAIDGVPAGLVVIAGSAIRTGKKTHPGAASRFLGGVGWLFQSGVALSRLRFVWLL